MTESESRTRTKNRNTELGDRACFCVSCGWARRYYPGVVEPPDACPSCDREIVSACPGCGVDILSVMSVECDDCGAALREPLANGLRIHRPKRRSAGTVVDVTPSASGSDAAGAADGAGSCGC